MFKSFIKLFEINQQEASRNKIVPLLFDFATIAIISMAVKSFVVNSHNAPFWQRYLAVFTVLIIAMHWYTQNVWRVKFEKEHSVFKYLNFIMVFSMAFVAVALALLVFQLNQSHPNTLKTKSWFCLTLLLYLGGLIGISLTTIFQLWWAFLANVAHPSERSLILGKLIGWIIMVSLVMIQATIILITKQFEWTIYFFAPCYFLTAFISNHLNLVDHKLLTSLQTMQYAKERYKHLIAFFISSTFIALITQIGYYWNQNNFWVPLLFFILEVLIIFQIYHLYVKVVYSGEPRISAKNLIFMAFLTVILTAALTVFGGFLINSLAHNQSALEVILCFSLALIYLTMTLIFTTNKGVSKAKIKEVITMNLITASIFLILGTLLFYVNLPMWAILTIILGVTIGDDLLDKFIVKLIS